MKIIITGATGFVGANLIRHFSNLGHQILALGRQPKPPTGLEEYAEYVVSDISKEVPSLEANICIHTAGLANDQASIQELTRVNCEGTQKVFEAVDCEQFIHISSASVYDNLKSSHAENEFVVEKMLSAYGKSKRLAELFLEKQRADKTITILRPRAIYGVGDRVLLPRILNLVKGNKIIVPGNLNIEVSLTHIENLIAAIECCMLERRKKDCQIYNVADPETYRLRTIIESLVTNAFGKSLPLVSLPVKPLKWLAQGLSILDIPSKMSVQGIDYVSKSCVLETSKIQSELGYGTPKDQLTNFYEALDDLTRWIHVTGLEKVFRGEKDLPWCSSRVLYEER